MAINFDTENVEFLPEAPDVELFPYATLKNLGGNPGKYMGKNTQHEMLLGAFKQRYPGSMPKISTVNLYKPLAGYDGKVSYTQSQVHYLTAQINPERVPIAAAYACGLWQIIRDLTPAMIEEIDANA